MRTLVDCFLWGVVFLGGVAVPALATSEARSKIRKWSYRMERSQSKMAGMGFMPSLPEKAITNPAPPSKAQPVPNPPLAPPTTGPNNNTVPR